MPQQTFTGEELPTTGSELEKQSAKGRVGIPQDIRGARKRKVAQTGCDGTTPFKVDASAPPIITESRGDVQGQSDLKSKGSIPVRVGALNENVNAWASLDKVVGAGRVNPVAVNKDNMIRDGKNTVQKTQDELTGGDGTANGERLNDNMKRETVVSVQIDNGSK